MAQNESTKYSTRRFRDAIGTAVAAVVAKVTSKFATYLYVPADSSDPTLSALPTTIASILTDAAEGDCQDQAAFISWAMDKDPKFAAHLLTRQDAVCAANWYLVPRQTTDKMPVSYDENPDLREFHMLLADCRLGSMIRKLNEAIIYGYAAVGIEWLPGGTGFVWHPIDPTSIKFDKAGGACLVNEDGDELPVEKLPPHSVVLHFAATRSDHPARRGLARMLLWFWLFKHMTLDRWAKFVSRFGIPFLIARMSRTDFENDTKRDNLIEALQKMSHKGIVATVGQGSNVEVGQAGNLAGEIHHSHSQMVDNHYAMLILGQLGSSEGEAGRLGNNRNQEDVRQDKRENDCNAAEETIQREILTPFWMYLKGGDGTDAPLLAVRALRARQVADLGKAAEMMFRAGHQMDRGFIQMETGIPFVDPPMPLSPEGGEGDGGAKQGNVANSQNAQEGKRKAAPAKKSE